jgi:DNA-binding CsgD family transcriptional regulator
MVTEEESTSHPFFTDFLVPHGMGRLAATGLAPARGTPVFLSTHRFIDRPRFTDSELVLLAHIGRHVENALRLGIRLIAADVAKIVLGDALACLGAAVFLVDSLGRVVFMNVRGEALLGDALVLTGKRLSARVGTSTSAFEETLNLAISNLAGTARVRPRPIILHGNDPTEFFAAYIQPVPVLVESSPALMFSDVKAAVVVMSSRASDPPDPSLVRDLLGVTLSEARLAALVGSGITPRQAADQLGVAEETARSALKRVFEKTGITRQSQLAGLLGRLVMR